MSIINNNNTAHPAAPPPLADGFVDSIHWNEDDKDGDVNNATWIVLVGSILKCFPFSLWLPFTCLGFDIIRTENVGLVP